MRVANDFTKLLTVLARAIRRCVVYLVQAFGLGSIDTGKVRSLCGLVADGILKEVNGHNRLAIG